MESQEPRLSDATQGGRHTFKLICARCEAVVGCDESILEAGGACPKCLTAIDPWAYPPLVEMMERRAAEAEAREAAESEVRRAEREREREERQRRHAERQRAELERECAELRRRAADAEQRRQALEAAEAARVNDEAARAKRDAEISLENAIAECFRARRQPDTRSLSIGERYLAAMAMLEAAIAGLHFVAAGACIIFGSPVLVTLGLFATGIVIAVGSLFTWAMPGIFLSLREITLNTFRETVLLQRLVTILGQPQG